MEERLTLIKHAAVTKTLFKETDSKLEPFHIYFKLWEFYRDKIDFDTSVKMYKQHLKLEQCLKLLRRRDTEGAKHVFAEIQKLDRNFPAFVRSGMDSLYLAMHSYFDYIIYQNAEEAIEKLRLSIALGVEQSKGFEYFGLSIPTQWINILRVLIRAHRIEEAEAELCDLLSLILLGQHQDKVMARLFENFGHGERTLLIADIFDNSITNLERSLGYAEMRKVLSRVVHFIVLQSACHTNYNKDVVQILTLVNHYQKGRINEFTEGLFLGAGEFLDVPDSLKRILVDDINSVLSIEECGNKTGVIWS